MNVRFLLLAFVFLGLNSYSQQLDSLAQLKIVNMISDFDERQDFEKIIDSCDKYIKYDFSICAYEAALFGLKAKAYSELVYDYVFYEEDYTDSLLDRHIYMAETFYDVAGLSCSACKLDFLLEKHYFQLRLGLIKPEGMKLLEENGFVSDIGFFSFSPNYSFGNNQWFGVELAISYYQRKYKLKHITKSNTIGGALFSLGFKKNISTKKGWGLNFSLISMSVSNIECRPINFTYMNNGEAGSFGYSPEIGFQIWHFHLTGGYNLAFKKSFQFYEKFYVNAKLNIPLYKFK